MLPQLVSYTTRTLAGSPSRIRKKDWRGTAGTKADLRSMSCWASSLTRTSTLSIWARRGECACPFCSQNESSGCDNNFGARYEASAMKHGLVTFLAVAFSLPIELEGSLVIARPAEFSLWTTPIFKLVVIARQARRSMSGFYLHQRLLRLQGSSVLTEEPWSTQLQGRASIAAASFQQVPNST